MMNRTEVADYEFKILLLGESSVGKTALLKRYSEQTFDESREGKKN